MTKINLAWTWALSCDKPDFQTVPAQIPGENVGTDDPGNTGKLMGAKCFNGFGLKSGVK